MTSKTYLVSYNGMTELWRGARLNGAKDIVISGYCFDGAVKSAMERRIRQMHTAIESHIADEFPETAAWLILKSWIVVVGCCCHFMHNALKWAVLENLATKKL